MQEKDMVNDILSMVSGSLIGYTSAIAQSSNKNLRETLQQIRSSDEQFQYQLSQVATKKGYYQPAQKVEQQDIQQTRSQLGG